MDKKQKDEIKKVVHDLTKNELKGYIKEVIYEYFGKKPWLVNIQIETLTKEVLRDLLICELKDLNINFKLDSEIKRNSENNENIIHD